MQEYLKTSASETGNKSKQPVKNADQGENQE